MKKNPAGFLILCSKKSAAIFLEVANSNVEAGVQEYSDNINDDVDVFQGAVCPQDVKNNAITGSKNIFCLSFRQLSLNKSSNSSAIRLNIFSSNHIAKWSPVLRKLVYCRDKTAVFH